MKIKGSTYFLAIIMLILLLFLGMSLTIENPKVKMAPLLISIVTIFLACIQFGKEVFSKQKMTAETSRDEKGEGGQTGDDWRAYLSGGAWIIGFFLAIALVGYLIAIPLYISAYIKSHGIRWKVALTLAAAATVITYGIFEFALQIEMYRGLIFEFLDF